jgi:hypothetical protein
VNKEKAQQISAQLNAPQVRPAVQVQQVQPQQQYRQQQQVYQPQTYQAQTYQPASVVGKQKPSGHIDDIERMLNS